jgi:hypothetical protein
MPGLARHGDLLGMGGTDHRLRRRKGSGEMAGSLRVEFREHVIENQHRIRGSETVDGCMGGESHRQSKSALFALTRLKPRGMTIDSEEEVVAVGPGTGDSELPIGATTTLQRFQEGRCPLGWWSGGISGAAPFRLVLNRHL